MKVLYTINRHCLFVAMVALFLTSIACKPERQNVNFIEHSFRDKTKLKGRAFGTSYNITISETLKKNDTVHSLKESIQAEITFLDQSMSNWNSESEISRLNNSEPGTKINISSQFREVFQSAQKINLKTHGFFDPGNAALFDLWGFDKDGGYQGNHRYKASKLPSQKLIRTYLKFSGIRFLGLLPTGIYRKNSYVKLNLSALAKGYLVDRLFLFLKARGYQSMMVEIGGEVRVADGYSNSMSNANDKTALNGDIIAANTPWKIGIEQPQYGKLRKIIYIASIENLAMATSGDYRNYFIINGDKSGRRYSHIIDPQTGYPARSGVVSATVIGPECMLADALATTLLVVKPKTGLQLLKKFPGYHALIIQEHKRDFKEHNRHRKQNIFQIIVTPGMQAFLKKI